MTTAYGIGAVGGGADGGVENDDREKIACFTATCTSTGVGIDDRPAAHGAP